MQRGEERYAQARQQRQMRPIGMTVDHIEALSVPADEF
jgi:hypothetical protein